MSASRLQGGPHGFLIAGTRAGAVAVWRLPDGRAFRIVEGAPGLADTVRANTQGFAGA